MGGVGIGRWFDRYRSCLAHRDLRLLFSALIVSQTGNWAYNVGLLAFVYSSTHSFAWVGLASIARFLPALLASTYGGVVAERTERVRLMVTADVMCMFWQIGLVVIVVSQAPVALALVLVALNQVTNVVYNPSVAATIPSIVEEADLVAANAINSTITNLVVILGPAIGALLLLAGPLYLTFAVNAASFGLSAFIVSRIQIRSRPVDVTDAGTAGPLKQMMVGVRTILTRREPRTLVSLSALASFIYGTDTVLFLAVSEQRLGLGSKGFGYLLAGLGLGGIIMALAMDRISQMTNLAPVILLGLALYSLPTAAFVVLHSPTAGFAIQVVRGAATLVVDVLAITSLQRSVPSDVLARVFGVFWAFVLSAMCLGALLAPVLVSLFGLDDALFAMALAPFAVGLLGFVSLRRVDLEASIKARALAPRVATLEQLGMFATAPRLVLERLASVETDITFESATVIITQGEPADAMYILEEGEVEVRAQREGGGPHRLVCTLDAPNYFGELGVIESIPRTATVIAVSRCRCSRIEGADLLDALSVAGPSASLMSTTRSRLGVTHPSHSADPGVDVSAPVVEDVLAIKTPAALATGEQIAPTSSD